MQETILIKDWQRFIEVTEKTNYYTLEYQGRPVQFRGQANSSWGLESSLLRLLKNGEVDEELARRFEVHSIEEYKSQIHLLESNSAIKTHQAEFLIDMQHYSCPTRLLDWTGNPFVALYFAVKDNINDDGAVFILYSNQLTKNIEEIHPGFSDIPAINYFEENDFDFVQFVFTAMPNERAVRQHGCFTFSNKILKSHSVIIEELANKANSDSGLYKLIIPSDKKLEFLSRLRSMNISSNNIFPGLDGFGASIREMLLARLWQGV